MPHHKIVCSGCGNCCSNLLPLSLCEIQDIKAFILEHNIQPVQHEKIFDGYDASCPFLSEDNRCNIYDIRPLICKVFTCNRKAPKKKQALKLCQENRELCNVRGTFFGDAQEVSQKFIVQLLLHERNLVRRLYHE